MAVMDRRKLFVAVALVSPLLAGCMPDNPRTELSWGMNDRLPHPVMRHDARVYAYRDVSRDSQAAPPVPKPRPDPASYVTPDAAPYRAPTQASAYTQATLPPPYRSAAGDSGGVAFAWPVNGRVISDFGTTGTGGRNDGINIATPMNAPIRAAAGGTVTYSGNELKDYGNLVLIRHAGGYVTAYAHADRLLVNRGDQVAKGQVIGYAGETGDVTSPQLHFEIRHDTAPVNPRSLLLASARNS